MDMSTIYPDAYHNTGWLLSTEREEVSRGLVSGRSPSLRHEDNVGRPLAESELLQVVTAAMTILNNFVLNMSFPCSAV